MPKRKSLQIIGLRRVGGEEQLMVSSEVLRRIWKWFSSSFLLPKHLSPTMFPRTQGHALTDRCPGRVGALTDMCLNTHLHLSCAMHIPSWERWRLPESTCHPVRRLSLACTAGLLHLVGWQVSAYHPFIPYSPE